MPRAYLVSLGRNRPLERLPYTVRTKGAPRDREIAAVAARQHGVISTAQLAEVGIASASLTRRIQSGRLHRVHRGVYAVGHPALSREGRWMGAVLACGSNAALSHRSAAALWELLPDSAGSVDVSVHRSGGRRRRHGLRLHRSRTLARKDVTWRHGIPVTTPARTISDLRQVATPEQVRKAMRQAAVTGFEIEGADADPTRSELEGRFLRLCRRHRLPAPLTNVRVGQVLVDFSWPDRRLIVETDGYRYHRGRQAFEDDRARDSELRLRGYEVARFTYRQVVDEPERVAAVLRTLLVGSAARPK